MWQGDTGKTGPMGPPGPPGKDGNSIVSYDSSIIIDKNYQNINLKVNSTRTSNLECYECGITFSKYRSDDKILIDYDMLKQLFDDIKNMKDRIKNLEDLIEYSPDGGKIYEEAKEHFESLK